MMLGLHKIKKRLVQAVILSSTLFVSNEISAQVDSVVHLDEYITIDSAENLYILGSFRSTSTVDKPIINLGTFNLQGNLIHNGANGFNLFGTTLAPPNKGNLRFFGNAGFIPQIGGTQRINMSSLTIDLTNSLSSNGKIWLNHTNVYAYDSITFLSGGLDVDTNTFNLFYRTSPQATIGITQESDNARFMQTTMNTDGQITLRNYPFTSGGSYSNLLGLGSTFSLDDTPGGNLLMHRRFDTLSVGDPAYNSITKSFYFTGNTNPAEFSSIGVNYIDISERFFNPNATNLKIFVSQDNGQVWRPRNWGGASSGAVTSVGIGQMVLSPSYTMITAATPCTLDSTIKINQIITSVVPNDTLLDITDGLVCDLSNINARLFATTDPGAYIEWRPNTSSTYTAQSPPGYYDATALGDYWVRATNIRGCVDSMSIEVISTTPASTAFTPSSSSVCLGTAINFSPDNAFDPLNSYLWIFGDSDSSTTFNPNHTYTSIGNYTVTFEVTNALGCVYSSTSTINIKAIPTASFIPTSACPGTAISFDNNSSVAGYLGLVDLNWDFGDTQTGFSQGNPSGSSGSGDITHIYSNEGTYNVTLTASANGCTSTPVVVPVTVYPLPVPSFTVSNACEGIATTFTNTSTISDASALTYNWDFTNGGGPTSTSTSPSYAYPSNGNYNVRLIVTSVNGCKDTLVMPITIYDNPVATFTATNACVNNLASFADNTPVIIGSTPYTYDWNFGDSSPNGTLQNETHPYTNPGTYNVILTVTTLQGCVGSVSNPVVIHPGPSVSFTTFGACEGSPANFINTSTNATSYFWDFPTISATATTTNTTQTYPNAGSFPVTLTATSTNGCSDVFTSNVTIHALPVVNLGTSVTTCGTTYLLDANPGGINNGSSFLWGTGDVTPQYTVTMDGNYNVTVVNPNGCTNSDNVSVTLNGVVTPTLGAGGSFCDSTILNAGYPGSTYSWNTTETTQSISVNSTGTYSVTVTDQNGCIGNGSVNITIVPGTPVNLGSNVTACIDNPVTLNAGAASSYLWSTGATTQTIIVPATGYYWVQNTNGGGCTSSDTIFVTYNSIPTVNLGADQTVCDQTSLNAFAANSSYLWSTTETTPSINITSTGTYIVVVTNTSTGCDNSDTVNVTINNSPVVNLGNDFSICSYGTGTIDAGISGATYSWNSGQTTQQITVGASGNYSVVVTDVNGCTGSDNITVTMLPLFSIELGPDLQFCQGSTLILNPNLSTTGNVYSWQDENQNIVGTAPTYIVADTGVYYLTVTDANGCVATDSITINPSNLVLHAFFLADSDIESGESVTFVNLSYPKPYDSYWYVNNVYVSSDSMPTLTFSPIVTPPVDTVWVKLRVDNTYCISEIAKPIVIHPAFAPGNMQSEAIPEIIDDPSLFTEINSSVLYPNPNRGDFNLFLDLNKETPLEINVYTITGKLIYQQKQTTGTTTLHFDFNDLSTGVYFMQVRIYNEAKIHKFVILPD